MNSLSAGFPGRSELEFYERHCLLVPIVQVAWPRTYVLATTERGLGLPVTHPEDLTSPDSLRRLLRYHTNGLHPFDAELGRNPLLSARDCSGLDPQEADETVTVTATDGATVQRRGISQHFSPWQAHVVARLREQKHYYVHSRFLRHIEPEHDLRRGHRLPEDTERIRALGGMASGFDALERYRFADQDRSRRVSRPSQYRSAAVGTPLVEDVRC